MTTKIVTRQRGFTLQKFAELTQEDRCDRCPAAAAILAVLLSGNELMFCAHHGRVHADALMDQGAKLYGKADR
jgi:hypothetical protein